MGKHTVMIEAVMGMYVDSILQARDYLFYSLRHETLMQYHDFVMVGCAKWTQRGAYGLL
jgi:hypothetical protein